MLYYKLIGGIMKKFSKIFLTTFVLMLSISRISTAKPTNLPVNEYGKIMILAYHEIGYPEGRYRRTPENFKKDLELLLEKGYWSLLLWLSLSSSN